MSPRRISFQFRETECPKLTLAESVSNMYMLLSKSLCQLMDIQFTLVSVFRIAGICVLDLADCEMTPEDRISNALTIQLVLTQPKNDFLTMRKVLVNSWEIVSMTADRPKIGRYFLCDVSRPTDRKE